MSPEPLDGGTDDQGGRQYGDHPDVDPEKRVDAAQPRRRFRSTYCMIPPLR